MSLNDKSFPKIVDFKVDDSPSSPKSSVFDTNNFEDLDFQSLFDASFVDNNEHVVTKNQVKKAGRKIRKNEGDLKDARAKIQAFRSEHEKPLKHIAKIVSCCSKDSAQVVTRLKRLDTIIDKLTRPSLNGKAPNTTCITNMNDIGGCRAIFDNIDCLHHALENLVHNITQLPNIHIRDIDNYIEEPKDNDCGYRSIHVIFEYDTGDKALRIEAQLRTRAQHLWATTVEIIDLIERTKIKTLSHRPDSEKSSKEIHWEKLLRVMSDVIAGNEGCIDLDEEIRQEIKGELKYRVNKVKAKSKLRSFKLVSEKLNSQANSQDGYYIVVIGSDDGGAVKVLAEHAYDDEYSALLIFNNIEKVASSMEGVNALMVATKDISSLNAAYPNYLGDCQAFINMLEEAMS